jgi:hypothetical protein
MECCAVWLLVRTDVSEEPSASTIRVTRIGYVVPSSPILVTPKTEELGTSETSVLTRATICNIPEYGRVMQGYLSRNKDIWQILVNNTVSG